MLSLIGLLCENGKLQDFGRMNVLCISLLTCLFLARFFQLVTLDALASRRFLSSKKPPVADSVGTKSFKLRGLSRVFTPAPETARRASRPAHQKQ